MYDCKILCDPWIENGEYFGSWSIVEKINKEKFYKEMNKCEFIYQMNQPINEPMNALIIP